MRQYVSWKRVNIFYIILQAILSASVGDGAESWCPSAAETASHIWDMSVLVFCEVPRFLIQMYFQLRLIYIKITCKEPWIHTCLSCLRRDHIFIISITVEMILIKTIFLLVLLFYWQVWVVLNEVKRENNFAKYLSLFIKSLIHFNCFQGILF